MSFPEALVALDSTLFIAINSAHTPLLDMIFENITWLGSGWIVTPILLCIVFLLSPRKQVVRIILFGLIGIGLSGIINSQIKKLVSRPRPVTYFSSLSERKGPMQTDTAVYKVHVLGPTLRNKSFPSGHSNTAFAAATFLVLLYGGWFWTSYIIAFLVAYSRIYIGAHFFFDTIGGAALGISIVIITWQLYYRRVSSPGETNDQQ